MRLGPDVFHLLASTSIWDGETKSCLSLGPVDPAVSPKESWVQCEGEQTPAGYTRDCPRALPMAPSHCSFRERGSGWPGGPHRLLRSRDPSTSAARRGKIPEPPGASVYSFLPGCDVKPGSKDRSFESPLKMAPSSYCLAGEKGPVNTGRKQPPASQRRDFIRTQPCGNLIWDLQNKDNKFLLFKPFGLWHLVLAVQADEDHGEIGACQIVRWTGKAGPYNEAPETMVQ
ncbi:uncharacterized protein LOC122233578 isoform X1 [Panthera tigris]|uniref:uncharacterized protein LOC122233578 isoform X1 n=1 Tax=Panthera tigris TaxID=9694 RepID=UPI001C6F67D8|nr:uncharacterized protein LOC122233578 isoform X1 [Panthera tigris]